MADKPAYSENQLQRTCIAILHKTGVNGLLYHHSPNEGRRTKGQQIHLFHMGLLAGWPDLEIFKDGRAYFIEFKVGKAKLTDKQTAVRASIEKQALPFAVIRTTEEFCDICKTWELIK